MFVPHATKKQSLRTTSTTANTAIGQGHIQIRSKYENAIQLQIRLHLHIITVLD